MRHLKYILTAICALASLSLSAQLTYNEAAARADRFFGYREWASASALYNYMLKERPDVASTYGRAIVANSMLGDSIQSMQLLTRAMSYNIPLDSVLSQVKKYSFIVGKGNLYEHFMLQAARENQWLARPLDNQLLKYYAFRNDGAMMIEYSQRMLKGAPQDIRFMALLAKGYMLEGRYQQAVSTWHEILKVKPDDYHTTLCLANYYASVGDKAQAEPLFVKAYAMHPTPYVQDALKSE